MSTKERLRRIRFALVPLGRPIDVSERPLDFENRFPRLRKKRKRERAANDSVRSIEPESGGNSSLSMPPLP